MIFRLILIAVVVIAFIGIVSNFASQASMNGAIQNLQTSIVTLTYAGEFDEIRESVNDFLKLRNIRSTSEGEALATNLDQRLNDLELVKIYCEKKISTLELAFEINPYQKLQDLCPSLKEISLSKAAELFRLI